MLIEAETENVGSPGALASSTFVDGAASCIADGPEAKAALKILVVDDDEGVLRTVSRILVRAGHRVHAASTPQEALSLVAEIEPDVCITDVIMEGMDGYEFCRRFLAMPGLEDTPVIVVTAFGEEEDRTRAAEAGAVGLIHKPFDIAEFVDLVEGYVSAKPREEKSNAVQATRIQGEICGSGWREFDDFKGFLRKHVTLTAEGDTALQRVRAINLYALAIPLGLSQRQIAQYVAEFMDVPHLGDVDSVELELGGLSVPFCKANSVVPIHLEGEVGIGLVFANPFDAGLRDTVTRLANFHPAPQIIVADPDAVSTLFLNLEPDSEPDLDTDTVKLGSGLRPQALDTEAVVTGERAQIIALSNEMLRQAVSARASDIHVEPKGDHSVVRFRIDGELDEIRTLQSGTTAKLIARFKALGHMDIAERRKPQDGALEASIQGRAFKLRLATSSTPDGESLVIRLLEPSARPRTLQELGMTAEQSATMEEYAGRSHGLVLVVGPTGSGKSTSIFSLLSQAAGARRSLISIEDPVEYRIPFANQQQVNQRAGVTFESLLKSALRQDPDILLIGEIRDLFSAKAALEFASSGHLTISSLHSSNATTAIFRLERLGIERGAIADAMLGVVAQKLLKRLCQCKQIRPIQEDEIRLLEPFTDEIPELVATPAGCPGCRQSGYYGREGIYEIIGFDREITRLVRDGASILEIRSYAKERRDFLISDHVIQKVRDHTISVVDAYESVLLEEVRFGNPGQKRDESTVSTAGAAREVREPARPAPGRGLPSPAEAVGAAPAVSDDDRPPSRVLVAEDDETTRLYLTRMLEGWGHEVVGTEDGAEALMELARSRFDLVLSDVDMPNLDGLKLLELMVQKNIQTPVIFLTCHEDEALEVQGLKLGAADFLRKPLTNDVLNARVERILKVS